MSWATCPSCGETFTSDTGFDKHRIKTPVLPGLEEYGWRCANAAEMEARGYHRNAKGWWCRDTRSTPPGSAGADSQGPDGSLGQGAA